MIDLGMTIDPFRRFSIHQPLGLPYLSTAVVFQASNLGTLIIEMLRGMRHIKDLPMARHVREALQNPIIESPGSHLAHGDFATQSRPSQDDSAHRVTLCHATQRETSPGSTKDHGDRNEMYEPQLLLGGTYRYFDKLIS